MTADFDPERPCWRVAYRSVTGPMTAIVRGYAGQADPCMPAGTEVISVERVGPDAPVIVVIDDTSPVPDRVWTQDPPPLATIVPDALATRFAIEP